MNVIDKVDAYCVQHFRGSVAQRQLKVILLYLGEEAYQSLHKKIELQLEHILTTMPVLQPVVVDGDSISNGVLEDTLVKVLRTYDEGRNFRLFYITSMDDVSLTEEYYNELLDRIMELSDRWAEETQVFEQSAVYAVSLRSKSDGALKPEERQERRRLAKEQKRISSKALFEGRKCNIWRKIYHLKEREFSEDIGELAQSIAVQLLCDCARVDMESTELVESGRKDYSWCAVSNTVIDLEKVILCNRLLQIVDRQMLIAQNGEQTQVGQAWRMAITTALENCCGEYLTQEAMNYIEIARYVPMSLSAYGTGVWELLKADELQCFIAEHVRVTAETALQVYRRIVGALTYICRIDQMCAPLDRILQEVRDSIAITNHFSTSGIFEEVYKANVEEYKGYWKKEILNGILKLDVSVKQQVIRELAEELQCARSMLSRVCGAYVPLGDAWRVPAKKYPFQEIFERALEDMDALDISRTADIGLSELQRILGQFISRHREEMVSGMVGKAVGTASYDETQKIIYARQELQITVLPDQLVSLQHMPMFRNACYLYVIQRKWNSHCALSGRGEDILNTGGEA